MEYHNLLKERQALEIEKKSFTVKEVKQLNQKTLMLNKKMEDYKTKREAFIKVVEQYNAKVTERNNDGKKGIINTP